MKKRLVSAVTIFSVLFLMVYSSWVPRVEAALSLVASGVPSGDPTTSWSLTLDSGIQAGDVIVVGVFSRNHTSGTSYATASIGGSGITRLISGTNRRINLYYKVADGSEASASLSVSGCVTTCTGGYLVFRGADPDNPIPDYSAEDDNNTSHAGFTPTSANSFIGIYTGTTWADGAYLPTNMACTDPGSMEPEIWQKVSKGGDWNNSTMFAVQQSGGPTATGNFTWTQSVDATASIAFAIQPAPPLPTVSTSAATSMSANSITFRGNLEDLGDANEVGIGFQYGKSEWTATSTVYSATTTTGVFTSAVGSLNPLSLYQYRAFASTTDPAGFVYGNTYYGYTADISTSTPVNGDDGKPWDISSFNDGSHTDTAVSGNDLILDASLGLVDSEGFESSTGDWTDTDASTCWTRDSGGTPSSSTGPTTGNNSTWYMFTETSNSYCNGSDDDSIEYTLASASSGYVDFYYHMYGSNMGTLSLDAYDGESWTTFWSKTGQQEQTTNSSAYTQVVGSTDALFPAGTQKIRFRYTGATGYRGDAAIDDVNVYAGSGYSDGSWISPSWDVGSITSVGDSSISWATTTPSDTDVIVKTAVNDSAVTPPSVESFTQVSNGGTIFGATGDLSGKYVWVTVELYASTDGADTPIFTDMIMGVNEGSSPPELTQNYYRWRNDDGCQTHATYASSEDNPLSVSDFINKGDRKRLRLVLSNTGAVSATSLQYQLEHASGTCTAWMPVPNTGSNGTHWSMDLSQYLTDGEVTTDSSGLTNPGGKTFTAGTVQTESNTSGSITLSTSQFTELEYSIRSTSNSETGLLYCFRLVDTGGTASFTYSNQPQITLSSFNTDLGGSPYENYGTGEQITGGIPAGGDEIEGNDGGLIIEGGGLGGGCSLE